MIVKKIILLTFFLIGNIQIILSLYYKNLSIGFLWYIIDPNSLVGFQSVLEKYFYFFFSNSIDASNYLFYFLDINVFLIIGVLFLIFPCFLSIKLSGS